jgi:3-oxoacyl-[acyl-carrier-protein] synthase-3
MYVPECVVTNEDVAKQLGISAEWIEKNIGVKKRHYVSKDQATSDLSINAAQNCIQNAKVDANEIDMIILASGNPDNIGNSSASLIKRGLGIRDCVAFDITSGCSGFVYAMSLANAYIKSGLYSTILVVATEVLSLGIDKFDKETYPFFGDGSGAVLLKASEATSGIVDFHLAADGSGAHIISSGAGGAKYPITMDSIIKRSYTLVVDTKAIWKFSTKAFPESVKAVTEKAGLGLEDIDYIIPHQATAKLIEYSMKKLNLPLEKTFINIDKYGNTSCASIPILFHELMEKKTFKEGDIICFVGFGGGLAYGSLLYKF